MEQAYPTILEIQRAVAAHFCIPLIEMKSARRSRDVARPRQIAMYLAKQRTLQSLPSIGRLFGNRDHTTVIHAIRQIERFRSEDPAFDQEINDIAGELAA